MLTFHNDPVQKIKYQTLYKDARESNHMMRGDYFDTKTQKGCLVGLPTRGNHHEQLSRESGIPLWMIHVAETIFEGLPDETFQEFPEKFIDAIPIGVTPDELLIVNHKLALFQLTKICKNTDHPLVADAIQDIIKLHTRTIEGIDPPTDMEWGSATDSAARSAADSAARSAARSAAFSAAFSATDSAAFSATRSADSAALSAARSATRSAAYSKISDEFLRLLKDTQPIPLENEQHLTIKKEVTN